MSTFQLKTRINNILFDNLQHQLVDIPLPQRATLNNRTFYDAQQLVKHFLDQCTSTNELMVKQLSLTMDQINELLNAIRIISIDSDEDEVYYQLRNRLYHTKHQYFDNIQSLAMNYALTPEAVHTLPQSDYVGVPLQMMQYDYPHLSFDEVLNMEIDWLCIRGFINPHFFNQFDNEPFENIYNHKKNTVIRSLYRVVALHHIDTAMITKLEHNLDVGNHAVLHHDTKLMNQSINQFRQNIKNICLSYVE